MDKPIETKVTIVTPSTLQTFVRASPFRAFRITMNSGKTYDVRHPEFIHVGRDFFNYYIASSPNEFPDRWETVSLLLIQSIEHLEGTPADKAPRSSATGACDLTLRRRFTIFAADVPRPRHRNRRRHPQI